MCLDIHELDSIAFMRLDFIYLTALNFREFILPNIYTERVRYKHAHKIFAGNIIFRSHARHRLILQAAFS